MNTLLKKALSVGLSAILFCLAPGVGAREAFALGVRVAADARATHAAPAVSLSQFRFPAHRYGVAARGSLAPAAAAPTAANAAFAPAASIPAAFVATPMQQAAPTVVAAGPVFSPRAVSQSAPRQEPLAFLRTVAAPGSARVTTYWDGGNLKTSAASGAGALGAISAGVSRFLNGARGSARALRPGSAARASSRTAVPTAVAAVSSPTGRSVGRGLRSNARQRGFIDAGFLTAPVVAAAAGALGLAMHILNRVASTASRTTTGAGRVIAHLAMIAILGLGLVAATGCGAGGGGGGGSNLTSTGPGYTPPPAPPPPPAPTRSAAELAANIQKAANNPATVFYPASVGVPQQTIGGNGDVVLHLGGYQAGQFFQYLAVSAVSGNLSYYVIDGRAVVQQQDGKFTVDPATVMDYAVPTLEGKDGLPYIEAWENMEIWVNIAADSNGGAALLDALADYTPLTDQLLQNDMAKARGVYNLYNSPYQTVYSQLGSAVLNYDGSVWSNNPGDDANVIQISARGALQALMDSIGTGWVTATWFDATGQRLDASSINAIYTYPGNYYFVKHNGDSIDTNIYNTTTEFAYTEQIEDSQSMSGYVQYPGDWIQQSVFVGSPRGDVRAEFDLPWGVEASIDVYGPHGEWLSSYSKSYAWGFESISMSGVQPGYYTFVVQVLDNSNKIPVYYYDENGDPYIHHYDYESEYIAGSLDSSNYDYLTQSARAMSARDPLSALFNSTVSKKLQALRPGRSAQQAAGPRRQQVSRPERSRYPRAWAVGRDGVPVRPTQAQEQKNGPRPVQSGRKGEPHMNHDKDKVVDQKGAQK